MSQLTKFTNQYPISKSLRFELKPIGQTEENIQKNQILTNDSKKADSYKEVKKIIDDFHRDFIEKALSGIDMNWAILGEKRDTLKQANRDNKTALQKELESEESNYRKEIVSYIKQSTPADYNFADITKAPLVKTILKQWLIEQDRQNEVKLLEQFKGFDGYFTGLHETRKNIYSDKDQSTALSFRIVNDNFPKFLDALKIYHDHFCPMIEHIKSSKFQPNIEQNINKLDSDFFKNKSLETIIIDIQNYFNEDIGSFNKCLNQAGIKHFNEIIAVINLLSNLYNQQKISDKKHPKINELFKQILAKSDKTYHIDKLNNDGEVIASITEYQQNLADNNTINNLQDIINGLANNKYNLNRIYWQNDQLTGLSNALFGDWSILNNALSDCCNNEFYPDPQNGKISNALEKKREKWLKQSFSIGFLQKTINDYVKINSKISSGSIIDFLTQKEAPQSDDKKTLSIYQKFTKIVELKEDYNPISKQLRDTETKTLLKESASGKVEAIKELLDGYQEILWFFKSFILKPKEANSVAKDDDFYGDLENNYHNLLDIIGIYNLVRNFITQKPYSVEKYKLNFENPTLAAGWDINKETDNTSIILERDGLYYLAIMNTKYKKVFEQAPSIQNNENCYQKLNYKLLSGANKMLPKVFFSKKGLETFNPPQKIIDLYKNDEHKKGNTFSLKSCHKLIDFFKNNISKYRVNPDDEYGWDVFGFNFSPTESYADISQFYKEVEQQGYKVWFSDVSKIYIDKCIEDGKLYLFQLYNKDFSPHSKGKKNLHTLYWQTLFSEQNMENTIYKLNGEAELFYRPASIKYEQSIWDKGHHANDAKKKQKYPIIKDRRFAQNKYFFHVPITINFKSKDTFNFNQKVQEFLKGNKNVNIIGIDRGEKNLAYYSVLDQQGKIIDQGSFNTINGVDYHKLLDTAEKQRDAARKNWKTINKIKDLKSGYISQVVHKITQLMVEHNAIVVMEDLNFGFKKGRIKIEKQVYQNLEKALINKLNYLSFKDYEASEAGSIANGLQLAAPFDSFAKMGKQTGFIFYVSAPYTSKIDFKTGFVPFKRYIKHETLEKSKILMQGITSIKQQGDSFVVDIDYSKIAKSQTTPQTKWKLHLDNKERYEWNHKERKNQKVDIYAKLKKCFEDNQISLDGNIAEHITQANKAKVFTVLFKYINLVSQMRFTSEQGEDYILSPIKNQSGNNFRTDLNSNTIPKDSDANGAYHIALKGLYMLHQRINQGDKDLFIKNEQWFTYSQQIAKNRYANNN